MVLSEDRTRSDSPFQRRPLIKWPLIKLEQVSREAPKSIRLTQALKFHWTYNKGGGKEAHQRRQGIPHQKTNQIPSVLLLLPSLPSSVHALPHCPSLCLLTLQPSPATSSPSSLHTQPALQSAAHSASLGGPHMITVPSNLFP